MRYQDLQRLQGKYAVLETLTWGSYLCGPLSVTKKGRCVRVGGPVLSVVGVPADGKPFLEEGASLQVSGQSVRDDIEVFHTPPEGPSYNDSVAALLERVAESILQGYEAECSEVLKNLQRPDSLEMCGSSFQNTRMTYRRLGIQIVGQRIACLRRAEQSFFSTLDHMRRRQVIGPGRLHHESLLVHTKGLRQAWTETLNYIDMGPTEGVMPLAVE